MSSILEFGNLIRLRSVAWCLVILLASSAAWGYSSGPLNGYCGDPPWFNNCTHCHNSFLVNSGNGLLQLLGLPDAYEPDSTYTLTIELSDPDQSRWGFEMTVVLNDCTGAGTLAPVFPDSVQVSHAGGDTLRDYAKHTALGTQEGMPSGSWSVLWVAPPANSDSVHFYLAGNAANGNGTNQGDYIYTISAHVPEFIVGIQEPPTAQPSTPILVSAYPNPFNPSLTLDLSGAFGLGPIRLELFDAMGRLLSGSEVSTVNGRALHVPLNLEYLPSGAYWLRATSPNAAAVTKLVKAK